MTIKEATDEIKTRWRDVLRKQLDPAKEKVNGETSYICPFCEHGKHGDGLTYNPESKTGLKCFGCGWTGTDIDLYAKCHGYDISDSKIFIQVVKEMADMLGIVVDDSPAADREKVSNSHNDYLKKNQDAAINTVAATENSQPTRKPNTPGKYQDKIDKATAALFSDAGKAALEYLHNRGLTDETLKAYKVGYCPDQLFKVGKDSNGNAIWKNRPGIIFPHKADCSYYSARSLDGKFFYKPSTKDAGSQILYNVGAVNKSMPVFIVEGQIDALSIIQSGGNAAALTGKEWKAPLMDAIGKRETNSPLILFLDDDADKDVNGGQEQQKEIAAELADKNIPFINVSIDRRKYDGATKDANDLLRSDPDRLRLDVRQNEKAARRLSGFIPYEISSYLNNGIFDLDIEYFKQYKDRKTGFSNIDKCITLYPGLACFGGSASIGKSSFMTQLTDNLVQASETVLYFSLEMDVQELTAKSLARRLYARDPATPLTNIDIKNGATSDRLDAARKEYAQDVKGKYYIIRSDFFATADSISEYVRDFIRNTGKRPIVIIDYLQLLSPPDDFKGDTRAAIDYAVKTFKQLQLDNELLVILVSNFNRQSYDSPASYSDFKESGAIEYTADYLWTLQLTLMSEERYYIKRGSQNGRNKPTDQEKSEMLDKALKADPRRVQFVSLKNRNGKQRFSCNFKYYPQYDTFIPDEAKDNLDAANSAAQDDTDNDFMDMPDDIELPFDMPVN